MQINKVTFIGKGGVGLLYGSMIAQALGNDAVEYVMDDARFERHAGDALTVNGKPCALKSVRASEATPADLVILTVKTTGLNQALKTMERVVGPNTLIASLCNGIASEQKIAERFGWEHTVLGICQGMDAVFLNGELTFTNAGEIRFGAAAGTELATVTAIDELYTRCGIAHTVESDVAHRMWAKLMLNDGINQTCMAYGGTYGSATEPGSEQRRCFVSAMRETLAVANAEGIELTEADLTQMVHLIEGIDPTRYALDGAGPHRATKNRSRGVRGHHLPPGRQTRYPSAAKRLALSAHPRYREKLVAPGSPRQQAQQQSRHKEHSPYGGFHLHL